MKKKAIAILTSVVLLTGISIPTKSETNTALAMNDLTYTYWMKEGQPKYIKKVNGSWQRPKKPNGMYEFGWSYGPDTKKYEFSSTGTWSISGKTTIPAKKVKASLSGKYTSSRTVTETTICPIPKGQKGTPKYRIKYKVYKQKYRKWMSLDGRKSKMSETKYVTFKTPYDSNDKCSLVKR